MANLLNNKNKNNKNKIMKKPSSKRATTAAINAMKKAQEKKAKKLAEEEKRKQEDDAYAKEIIKQEEELEKQKILKMEQRKIQRELDKEKRINDEMIKKRQVAINKYGIETSLLPAFSAIHPRKKYKISTKNNTKTNIPNIPILTESKQQDITITNESNTVDEDDWEKQADKVIRIYQELA